MTSLDSLSKAARFLLAWRFAFEDPMPSVFWERVLQVSSMDFDNEEADAAKDALVKEGWATIVADEDGDETLSLTEAAVEAQAAILEPFQIAAPAELNAAQICFLHDLLEAGGFMEKRDEFEDGWRGLADNPRQQLEELIDANLVLQHLGETWYVGIAPGGWLRREEIRQRFLELQPELREALHASVCTELELPDEDPLARTLGRLDRALFVPDEARLVAYKNVPLKIVDLPGDDWMTTSQPGVIAHILRAVTIEPGDRVLLCGAKSGVLAVGAADLAGPAGSVCVLENHQPVLDYARSRIDGFPDLAARIELLLAPDITIGDEARAPWDVVIVNGALAKIPREILTQTSDSGRVLFFMHSLSHDSQRCYVVRKNQDMLEQEHLSFFNFTPIIGRWGWDDPDDLNEAYRRAREAREREGPARKIDHDLPYPLANAYGAARSAGDAGERHTRALKAWEGFLRYLAAVQFGAWRGPAERPPAFARHLHILSGRPSLGHWLAAARDLSAPVDQPGLAEGVRSTLRSPLRHRAFTALIEQARALVPSLEVPTEQLDLLTLFAVVVAYRNKSGEGHGGARAAADLELAADALLEALGQALASLPWLTDHRLIAFESLTLERGAVRLRVLDFRGASRPQLVPEAESAAWYTAQREQVEALVGTVAVVAADGTLTGLDPWFVWGRGTSGHHDELFFLGGRSGSGDPVYGTAHDHNAYPAREERSALEALLADHPVEQRRVDPAAARATFEALLDTFLADGVLDAKEMTSLCATLRSLGLFDDDTAAQAYIRQVAEERNPGVIFEE